MKTGSRLISVSFGTHVLGMMAKKNPAMTKAIRRAHSIPPHAVKSIFVWKAKMVKARVTPIVMATAIQMAWASKIAHTDPSMNPSATK